MSTVAELWALQVTDLAVEEQRRRLAEIEQQLGETPELAAARQRVADNETELAHWRQQQQQLETQVRDLTEHIRGAESQLMSGRVRNPKELEGMEANVGSLKRRRSALEDEILNAMIEIDRCRENLAASRAELERIQETWQTAQDDLTRQQREAMARLQMLAGDLTRQWSTVSPEDKELYRSLRQRKAGRGLAPVQRGNCQACGVILPTMLAQQIRSEQERGFCPTCGRLLYSPD